MIGLLLNGTVDLTIPDVAETMARHDAVDFAHGISFYQSFLFLLCMPLSQIETEVNFSRFYTPVACVVISASALLMCAVLQFYLKFFEKSTWLFGAAEEMTLTIQDASLYNSQGYLYRQRESPT